MTAVDRNGYLLERAQEWYLVNPHRGEWVRDDMRRFQRPDSYVLILNLYTSFWYFEDPGDDLRVLRISYQT